MCIRTCLKHVVSLRSKRYKIEIRNFFIVHELIKIVMLINIFRLCFKKYDIFSSDRILFPRINVITFHFK